MRPAAPAYLLAAFCCSPVAGTAGDVLDEVVVEGSRYTSAVSIAGKTPLERRDIPASLSVITERRIADQNLTTVADALRQVTGVTVIPNDGVQSQYKSRGYVLGVMNDGVPALSSLSGYQQFDLAIYERVEVLRGPTGLLQGSADPGGSVNLVSKRGRDQFGFNTTLSTSSWSGRRATVDITGPLHQQGALRARTVGVYEDRDHFTEPAHYERRLGYGSVDWDITEATTLSASLVGQFDRSRATYIGLPAFASGPQLRVPGSSSIAQRWNRSDWDTTDFTAAVTHRIGDSWRVVARWWQRDQQLFFHDSFALAGVRDTDYTLPFGRRKYDYDYARRAVDVFASGEVSWLGRTHSVLVGFNYDRFDQDSSGVQRTALAQAVRVPFDEADRVAPLDLPYEEGSETQRWQSGFYLQARFSVTDAVTLIAGGRLSDFDSRSRAVAPSSPTNWRQGDRDDDRFTPTAGVVYDVNAWLALYASYADTFSPQSTLLRADGTPLDPRIGRQYEVGAKADWFEGALQASAAVFDLRDEGRSLGDTANPGFFLNAGEVASKGWELELVGRPAPGYEIQVGYSRLDSKFLVARPDLQGDRFSALEPKHAWKAWAVRRFGDDASSGLTIGAGLSVQSGIEFEPPRTQGGYTLANAMLGYRFSEHLAIDVNASNIFDKVYYTRLGGMNSYNTFGAPRNYSARLSVTF